MAKSILLIASDLERSARVRRNIVLDLRFIASQLEISDHGFKPNRDPSASAGATASVDDPAESSERSSVPKTES